jgi:hypothetical protein
MRYSPILAVGILFFVSNARAQEAPKLTTLYFGVKACLTCHEKQPEDYENLVKLSHSDAVFTSRLAEYNFWSKHDKHKDAAKALTNERSQQIAKIMGLRADLVNEPKCANCHGVYIDPAKEIGLIDKKTFQGADRFASGVSCVVCHGPKLEWVNKHAEIIQNPAWSSRSRAEKKRDFGLNDLWDPVERSQLCYTCHIGSMKDDKFVTHEMYAAGHPPLPGIEIATFSEAMPAHWESLTQKAARARERGAAADNGPAFLKAAYGVDADAMEMEQARIAAVAGMVALRTSTKLIGDFAQQSVDGKADRMWPELAFYDCYACHHDLKTKSWRLERGYAGKPGRPAFRPWPFALARFGDRLLDPSSAPLDPALSKWNALFNDTPFGNAKQVAAEANQLTTLIEERIKLLTAKKFDRALAERAALQLVDLAKSEVHDFDSARQLAWALRTIEIELQNNGGYGLVKPGENRVKGPLVEPFAALERTLQLRLPEGQVEIVPTMLDNVFGQISVYEPRLFRQSMLEIEKVLHGRKAK